MQKTPWAEYVVPENGPLTFFRVGVDLSGALVVALLEPYTGRQVHCRAEYHTLRIGVIDSDTGNDWFDDVPLYRLSLTRHLGEDAPRLCVHPFALAHMYVSGQLSPQTVVSIGARTGPDTFQLARPLDPPTPLGAMLGSDEVILSLCPRFDLSVQ